MIGIVIPAHDEASLVGACIEAALAAARHGGLYGESVEIVVVLDACSDGTAEIVARHPVASLSLALRNVGAARAAGAQQLLARGARWLAFTDADSRVADDWLVQQLRLQADVVCGTVAVDDWSDHPRHALLLEQHFRRTYTDADGHRHIHGANLGVSAQAYQSVGGFLPRASSEDVALVQALQQAGARIAWSAAPRVVTSARRVARAPAGFAAALCSAVDAMRLPVPVLAAG
ncbi:glycosyltransferase family 2 protein [Pseudorhodoferax sp. Leaf267]|uniref:glycosyltransferase n=1 Tax=Pseudorhodoferax sp. Leaf267 TaxID=1736316 RepID=UPI0006FA8E81|nr:glycosyltransferase [Pseudorhodoferax sp. Leaf267]KQP23245.1 glycosyl transferase [Pseudorhodoferax sp. Leaf267]